jgi:deoxyribodipyrimidine photo-lyase
MKSPVNIFWFRRDLRLNDNTGLFHALKSGLPVIPVFIFDEYILSELEDRHDRRVSFIYDAIQNLNKQLNGLESSMVVVHGKPVEEITKLTERFTVEKVFANHDYEPYVINRDGLVKEILSEKGIQFHTYKDQVIFEKNEIVKPSGASYSVFTPYSKKWKATLKQEHLKQFIIEKYWDRFYQQEKFKMPSLSELGFIKSEYPEEWKMNETIIKNYNETRDIPSMEGTSRVGIHLRFGTISIRSVVKKALELNETFLNELIWREFFMQMLWREPRLEFECFRKEYDAINWRNNEIEFALWCEGRTGYPIVDAGMRELNTTGFMHNRVRMITASFLVKHLLIDWRWGEAWFAQKLLDYELASNLGNWQWVAGCGCDAAPYFRIFNPETQTKRFDPEGKYIRKWVPEFETLSYPSPIVEHQFARNRCLKAFKSALQK